MKGYIANTDHGWFTYLLERSRVEPWEEVNFWAPSPRSAATRTIAEYGPFLFRLKSPHRAIAGFGFYRHATALPLSLAWELFGQANGAASLAQMRAHIGQYRPGSDMPGNEVLIGCRSIVIPTFFERHEWVAQPADWKDNIVQGKTYDLTHGEGARVWEECYRVALGKRTAVAPLVDEPAGSPARYGPPVEVRHRLGQGSFRMQVVDAYGRACAVTTEHSLPVLEAAHIRPFAQEGTHEVSNGILLRSDLHRLFDRGYVTVDPDFRFRVSQQLHEQWHNGRVYYELADQPIQLPEQEGARPRREFLEWHRDHVFLG